MKYAAAIIAVAAVLFSGSSFGWTTYSFQAKLDGHTVWNAITPMTTATGDVSFPIRGTESHLFLGKESGGNFAGFRFSTSPNLTGGSFEHNGRIYDGSEFYKVPISFDGEVATITLRQDNGNDILYIVYTDWFLNKLKGTDQVIIQLPWYSQNSVYFVYDVKGSAKAFSKLGGEK